MLAALSEISKAHFTLQTFYTDPVLKYCCSVLKTPVVLVLVLLCWILGGLEKQTPKAEFTVVHTPWNSQITHHTSLDYFQNRISNLTVTVTPPQQTFSAFWYIQELTHPLCCTGKSMQKRPVYQATLKNSHSEMPGLSCRFLFPGELPLSLSFTPCFCFHWWIFISFSTESFLTDHTAKNWK